MQIFSLELISPVVFAMLTRNLSSGASFNIERTHRQNFSERVYISDLPWLVASFTIVSIHFFASEILREAFSHSMKEAAERRSDKNGKKPRKMWYTIYSVYLLRAFIFYTWTFLPFTIIIFIRRTVLVITVFTVKNAFPILILFKPFFLILKGDFVTFRRIYLCVKSHSFIFSLILFFPFVM